MPQATKASVPTTPNAARQATNAGGSIPASKAKRDSGPSMPNSVAAASTNAKPTAGVTVVGSGFLGGVPRGGAIRAW